MIIKENLYDDIMKFLDDCGGYTDYWSWASEIDKVYDDDEDNWVEDEEDFEESVKFKEASEKSYWKYYMNDSAIERIENSEYGVFNKNNIRKVNLYPCENEEDCYKDDFSWAVCYYDRPNKAFFGDKEDAYIALMDYLNTSMYEKEHNL